MELKCSILINNNIVFSYLLIVPYGIEIGVACVSLRSQALLIVPYGIEIRYRAICLSACKGF